MKTIDEPNHGERIHHPYSPSSLQSREACPCYDGEQSDDEGRMRAAVRGTLQHEAMETGVDNLQLTDVEAAAVRDCASYVENVRRELGANVLELVEPYVPIDDCLIEGKGSDGKLREFEGTTAGYLDVALINKDRTVAQVLDWKFGRWDVEPADTNRQGHAYLLGLWKMFPTLEVIKVHFVMPHRDEIDAYTFTRADFERLYLEVCTIVARAIKAHGDNSGPPDFSMANPTVSGCLFCRHKGDCRALAEMALKVGHKYDPILVPEEVTPSLIKEPKGAGQAVKVAALMESWAKAVRKQITERACNDEDFMPEGYQLVRMQRREIVNAEKFKEVTLKFLAPDEAVLLDNFKGSLEDAMEFLREIYKREVTDKGVDPKKVVARLVSPSTWEEAQSITLGTLEDAINDLAPRGHKKEAVEAFSESLENEEATKKGDPYFVLKMKTNKKPKAESK
jgi:hypothetical protein